MGADLHCASEATPGDPTCRVDDQSRLAALAAYCDRFSPAVGVESSADPDSLLLDITGLAHLFGGETALARQIVDDFAQRGLNVRVAIADTVGAAWAVRRVWCRRPTAPEKRGRDAWDVPFGPAHSCDPRGSPRRSRRCLGAAAIEFLRLTDEMGALLHQLGIEQIGQLEMLARRACHAVGTSNTATARSGTGAIGRAHRAR